MNSLRLTIVLNITTLYGYINLTLRLLDIELNLLNRLCPHPLLMNFTIAENCTM